jgi:hypothetical protein
LNGEITNRIKEIKDPINAIRADIIKVEKTFKSESNKIRTAAEQEFQEYEDEKTRKAKEAQDKKDAELNAKVNAANEAAETATKQAEKANVLNAVKYTQIAENITEKATNSILTMNEGSLAQLKLDIGAKTFEKITANLDTSVLEDEVLGDLRIKFSQAKKQAEDLIQDKLDTIEKERNTVHSQQPVASTNPLPQKTESDETELVMKPDSPYTYDDLKAAGWNNEQLVEHGYAEYKEVASEEVSIERTTNEQFIFKIVAQISTLKSAVENRINEFGPTPELAELNEKLSKVLE